MYILKDSVIRILKLTFSPSYRRTYRVLGPISKQITHELTVVRDSIINSLRDTRTGEVKVG